MLVRILGYLFLLLIPFSPLVEKYNEAKFVTPVKTALVQKDADAFVDLLSDDIIEKNPGINNGIETMMNSIEGEVTDISYSNDSFTTTDLIGTTCYQRYVYIVTTTEDTYTIYLSYCTMSLLNEKECGINRIGISHTIENGSRILEPDLYFTNGKDRVDDEVYTRSIRNAKGTLEAREIFLVGDNGSSPNVDCRIKQSNGMAILDENIVKVWFVPEGEEMTEERRQNPTFIEGGENPSWPISTIEPGRYWLYAESNNPDLEYSISIQSSL